MMRNWLNPREQQKAVVEEHPLRKRKTGRG